LPPKDLVLGFDTSAAHCAAALISGDRVLVEKVEPMQKGQAERLVPLLQEVMDEGGSDWSDLSAIGVGIGPGNFTGIRISVSAARGLALALGIPAVGVSGFEAQAYGQEKPVYSIIDARRDQIYLQKIGENTVAEPQLLAHEHTKFLKSEQVVGTSLEDGMPNLCLPAFPLAVAIAYLAAKRYRTQQARPAPLYIREADAAPPRDPAPVIIP